MRLGRTPQCTNLSRAIALLEKPLVRALLLALAFSAFAGAAAEAQNVTLTITNDGPVSGAVGVQGPNGNVCNPNPGGGGGGTCVFTYRINTPLRMTANSPKPTRGVSRRHRRCSRVPRDQHVQLHAYNG